MNLMLTRLSKIPRNVFRASYSTPSSESSTQTSQNIDRCDILSNDEIEFEVEEVRIALPFGGQLAGKWWGDKSVRPFVCMHGWQDNAGSFDRLIPLLPRNHSYLSIDLPGHGLSSRIPHGMQYHTIDNLYTLNNLAKEYNWDKISIIGHSLGSILAFLQASVFPSKVDLMIGIDALKPMVFDPVIAASIIEERVEDFILADQRNQMKSEPPAYPLDEIIEKWCAATKGSVTKECAHFLMRRNLKKSDMHPGKYYFQRDSRLKYSFGANFPQEVSVELARRINMPYLFIKAKNSPYYEKKSYHEEVANVLKENPKFEYHTVDSTHHLHLTEPEKVAGIISDFILKHKSNPDKLS